MKISAISIPRQRFPRLILQKFSPAEKNFTDGEIALEKMLSFAAEGKIDGIEIYGGGGGREDHFIGNLHLLYRACLAGVGCVMATNHALLSMHRGKFILKNVQGKTVSLLPFGGDAHILTNRGLFYPTEDLTLVYGSCRGISNVGVSENAEIDCDGGGAARRGQRGERCQKSFV